MLDPRYLRYMSLEAHALTERQPRPVPESDETAAHTPLVGDPEEPNSPDAA